MNLSVFMLVVVRSNIWPIKILHQNSKLSRSNLLTQVYLESGHWNGVYVYVCMCTRSCCFSFVYCLSLQGRQAIEWVISRLKEETQDFGRAARMEMDAFTGLASHKSSLWFITYYLSLLGILILWLLKNYYNCYHYYYDSTAAKP